MSFWGQWYSKEKNYFFVPGDLPKSILAPKIFWNLAIFLKEMGIFANFSEISTHRDHVKPNQADILYVAVGPLDTYTPNNNFW